MSEFCIEYQAVSKSYGSNSILEDLSLNISSGITTAIVGESGSGKSTLVQMADGLVVPEQGRVSVFGTEINSENIIETRKNIGYSVQGAGLFPHLSVFDNVTLMAKLHGWPEAKLRSRYDQVIHLLEVDEQLSQRFPYSLSGGQQQRVSLCRALMLNPNLLLLDEPFSALDPVTRETIHQVFARLQQIEARSIVLVTHDMGEAIKLAQEIIVVYQGKIEQQASADEIQSNPASDYVRKLFRAGGLSND